MSGANYEYCPGCDRKALYVGEDDVPEDVEVWHRACREKRAAEGAAAEREAIIALADERHAIYREFIKDPEFAFDGFADRPFADLLRARNLPV